MGPVTRVSPQAEAMNLRVASVSRAAAVAQMDGAQAVHVMELMRGITQMIVAGKSLIVMADDHEQQAFYPSEAMITAMDDLERALRPRPPGAAPEPLGVV